MNTDTAVTIAVTLPEDEGLALAQLMKRLSWVDWRQCAVDDSEAYACGL